MAGYKSKPNPWIRTEDLPFWESNELMCWQKVCPCWCRKKRFAAKWEIRPAEKESRWNQNYELLKLKSENTAADTYGASSDNAVPLEK